MMGGQCSKKNGADSSPRPQPQPASDSSSGSRSMTPTLLPVQITQNSMFSAHLSSYEAACTSDPSLKSFDAVVQQRTVRVIGTLEMGVGLRSLSFDALKEMTDCMLEIDQEVVKVILEHKKDVWKNKDMLGLVEQYFDNSMQTLEFCTSLETCLKRVASHQLIVRATVSQFEEELQSGSVDYERTLQALAKFKAAGDPFTDEFFAMFQSVLVKQYVMLEKLLGQKRDIDKKLKSLKMWRRISNVIFVAAFVTVLICSIVAAAITAPPVVTALLGALAVPLGSMGKWCSSLWNRYGSEVRRQRELISSIHARTLVTLKDLENIRVLVNKLETKIQSLMQTAQIGLDVEGSLKIVMDEIKKNLEAFTETTEMLSQQNNKCIQEITIARRVIVQRIMNDPSS